MSKYLSFLGSRKLLRATICGLLIPASALVFSGMLSQLSLNRDADIGKAVFASPANSTHVLEAASSSPPERPHYDRPSLTPKPEPKEIWECEVVVVGGSLGGVAAAIHSMQSGATTCLIGLAPWLGGQISSQGVPALDQSLAMRDRQNFSPSWQNFKERIRQQPVELPAWSNLPSPMLVRDLNRCWVSNLCFHPG